MNITALFLMTYVGLASVHENIFSANLNGVAIHAHRWVLANLAGGHVILPAMPRAGHFVAVHNSLAQRPASMQAGIVDGVELAADICEGNRFALHLKLSDRSRRDFIRFRCSRKRHLVFTLLRYGSYFSYLGSGVCATITPRLNSSTMCGFRRTSVGRFASVICRSCPAASTARRRGLPAAAGILRRTHLPVRCDPRLAKPNKH